MSTLQFTVKEIKLLVILNTSKKLSNSIKLKLQRGKKVFENALFLVVDISLFPPPLYSPPPPSPSPQTNIVFKTLKSFFNHKQH